VLRKLVIKEQLLHLMLRKYNSQRLKKEVEKRKQKLILRKYNSQKLLKLLK
jgi:hypothetical protein